MKGENPRIREDKMASALKPRGAHYRTPGDQAPDDPAVAWLLKSADPSVRYLTRTELLGEPARSARVRVLRRDIPQSARVRALLNGQRADGGFGVHPYQKWTGAHWRLVALAELALPAGDPRAGAAADDVLRWLTGDAHRNSIRTIEGRVRRCASQEGNALGACSRLGLAGDPRVRQLARSLVLWQWPDGGWNCDKIPGAMHSSFHETITPLWGLIEYERAKNDASCRGAIRRAAEFLLRHHLFRSERTGKIADPHWLKLRFPPYWHYDILQGLRVLSLVGKLDDPRAREALDLVEQRRRPDGCWKADGFFWRPAGSKSSGTEVVDWGRSGPNEMVTLNALRVLRAAGRLG